VLPYPPARQKPDTVMDITITIITKATIAVLDTITPTIATSKKYGGMIIMVTATLKELKNAIKITADFDTQEPRHAGVFWILDLIDPRR
jgi:hypothetical protein